MLFPKRVVRGVNSSAAGENWSGVKRGRLRSLLALYQLSVIEVSQIRMCYLQCSSGWSGLVGVDSQVETWHSSSPQRCVAGIR